MTKRPRLDRRSRRVRWSIAILLVLAVFGAATARLFIWRAATRPCQRDHRAGGAGDRRPRHSGPAVGPRASGRFPRAVDDDIGGRDAQLPPAGSPSYDSLLPSGSEHDAGRGKVHRRGGRPTRLEFGHPGDHARPGVASPAMDCPVLLR